MHEQASRIDEAITAVQNFVRRTIAPRAGVDWSRRLRAMWDGRFASFQIWQACKRRELYKENWIEWIELDHARKSEGFRFLESELRSASLNIAVPGGLDWWPQDRPPLHPALEASGRANRPECKHCRRREAV